MRLQSNLRHSPRQRRRWPAGTLIGAGVLAGVVLLLLMAPLIVEHDPLTMDPVNKLHPPGREHPLGTDPFGRDVLSRLLWGGRRTLSVAGAAALLTVGAGLLLGLLAGFYGGAADELIMRLVDVMLSFPGLLLMLVFVAMLGSSSRTLAIAVGIAGVPVFGRVIRSSVLSVRGELYVEAAQSVGCRNGRMITRHILPNILGAIVALATVQFGWAILNASAMSFLGFGESPSVPEWGTMLNLGRGYLRDAPWVSAAPGLAITFTVLSVNLLGDALQHFLDPTQSR